MLHQIYVTAQRALIAITAMINILLFSLSDNRLGAELRSYDRVQSIAGLHGAHLWLGRRMCYEWRFMLIQ